MPALLKDADEHEEAATNQQAARRAQLRAQIGVYRRSTPIFECKALRVSHDAVHQ